MKRTEADQQTNAAPAGYRRSRIEYTKETERRVFFAMTALMLVAGVLYKTGVW